MALPVSHKLFIEPTQGIAYASFSGSSQISNPSFFLGDKAQLEIYLVKDTGLATFPRQEADYSGLSFKVAVGQIDESPTGGTWLLSYGGNTTSALAYNATAAQVQAALNALASITSAGGVVVTKVGDNYNVVFNQDGARTELTSDAASLTPLSTAGISVLQEGTVSAPAIYLVHLQRTVAAYATSFTQVSASVAAVTALSAWDGGRATYRVSISPDPKGGTFTLAFDAQTGTDVTTSAISVGASALDVQNALNRDALLNKVTVQQVGAFAWDVTVTAQPGTNGLTVSGAGLLSFSGFKGELNLNTASAIALLDGADFIQTTLEVEITSDSKPLTVLQIPCLLKSAVVDEAAIEPLQLDTYLSQATADGRYYRLSNNLSEGTASTIRGNLSVYSISQVDTALALKANTSHTHIIGDVTGLQTALDDKLSLTGGTVTGNLTATGTISSSNLQVTGGVANIVQATTGSSCLISTGAVTSGQLKTIEIGTNGLSGSTTNISLGSGVSGATNSILFNGTVTSNGALLLNSGASSPASTITARRFVGQPNSGVAGVNIGTGGTDAASTTAGDLWIASGGVSLNFRDATGSWRQCLTTSSAGLIDVNTTSTALRITQRGTGEAIRVEDSTTPDNSSFIVGNDGKVGVQVNSLAASPATFWVNGSAQVDGHLTIGSGWVLYFGTRTFTVENDVGSNNLSGNFSATEYPYEVQLKINGINYAVPARMT